jgi:lipopolysaccharide heptosyltransferase II
MVCILGKKEIDTSEVDRILVRGANWIGDVVMGLPALEAVRANFPGRTIAVLAKPWVAALYESHPSVDEVIPYRKRNGVPGSLLDIIRTARLLHRKNFDLAILFQNAFEAALLAFLAGIRYRVGYNTDARGFLLSHSVVRDPGVLKLHQVEYYLSILRSMGWEAPVKDPVVFVNQKDEEATSRLLATHGVASDDFLLGLSPGATYGRAKRWPAERFAAVGNRAMERWGSKIVLIGSEAEKDICEALGQELARPFVDLSGVTTLEQAMALIKRCQLFLCNDSGLMHVAAALNVPTLAVFGSTDAAATGPRGKHARIAREPVECSPCLEPECQYGHFRCMLSMDPGKVWNELENLWRIVYSDS